MKIQCCVCKKVREQNVWTHQILWSPQNVSHTYCPDCLQEAKKEAHELIRIGHTGKTITA